MYSCPVFVHFGDNEYVQKPLAKTSKKIWLVYYEIVSVILVFLWTGTVTHFALIILLLVTYAKFRSTIFMSKINSNIVKYDQVNNYMKYDVH